MESNTTMEIVLVDDEPPVLKVHSAMLRKFGHKVSTFCSPDEAKKYILNNHNQIDLLITDFCMPSMNGSELLHCIRTAGINIPALILTGFPDEVDPLSRSDHGASILCKPVRINTLLEQVSSMQLATQ